MSFVAVAGCVGLVVACDKAADKPKEEKKAAPACAKKFSDLSDKKADVTCSCAAKAEAGAVWGTDVYTQDSDICAAAVHVGAIAADKGGEVTVKPAPGCKYYRGTSANGISTSDYGAYGESFAFAGHGDGACEVLCPSSFNQLEVTEATELACQCRPDLMGGSVWGSGTYTQDSAVCLAAVHAGVVAMDKGGEVKAKAAPGCKAYEGTEANGVSSQSWGEFGASFYFPEKGEPECSNVCPSNFQSIPEVGDTTEYTCKCGPNAVGSVYGTGVYTRDSSICAAAVHAGVVEAAAGGEVTVKAAPGCQKYVGSEVNGVGSAAWGPYEGSFFFPAKGDGACAP